MSETATPGSKTEWIDVSKCTGSGGREDCQYGWQNWVGHFFHSTTILDVGAGLGLSRTRLGVNNNYVELQDIGPELLVDYCVDIAELPAKSFEVVTAFDVIEHVVEDKQFLANLVRLARNYVIITTPNYVFSEARNVFHCREYTPEQFVELLKPYKIAQFLAGASDGSMICLCKKDDFIKHQYPHQAAILHTE